MNFQSLKLWHPFKQWLNKVTHLIFYSPQGFSHPGYNSHYFGQSPEVTMDQRVPNITCPNTVALQLVYCFKFSFRLLLIFHHSHSTGAISLYSSSVFSIAYWAICEMHLYVNWCLQNMIQVMRKRTVLRWTRNTRSVGSQCSRCLGQRQSDMISGKSIPFLENADEDERV